MGVGAGLLGRVINRLGKPIDGKGRLRISGYYPVNNNPPHPLKRPRINQALPLGVKCIDGLLTLGKDREWDFRGKRRRKKHVNRNDSQKHKADVNVIALIGERGRK